VIGPIVFTRVCCSAVFFMLTFLCVLVREARRPRNQFTNRHERASVAPGSIERRSSHVDRRACLPDRTGQSTQRPDAECSVFLADC
jgi:hypothetical protein